MTSLAIAACSVDITPRRPTGLGAGKDPTEPFTSVNELLEANVALLCPADGEGPVLLVSLDLLYPGERLRSELLARLPEIAPERLWVAASHTHRAPLTDAGKPGLGNVDGAYVDFVIQEVTRAARQLLLTAEESAPAHISAANGRANHSVNRRRATRRFARDLSLRRKTRIAPNRRGPRDETLTVIRAQEDGRDTPTFLLWNYACHPVAHPEPLAVSAHYPSAVRNSLRERFQDPQLPVLFFQGFSGNTRPSASSRPSTLRNVLKRLAMGPSFFDMTAKRYRSWCEDLAQCVVTTADATTQMSDDGLFCARTTMPTERIADGTRPGSVVSFQALGIGDSIMFLGVSAEMVAEYAAWARAHFARAYLICVGCIDDTFGYVPTEAMLAEGGYEVQGFCANFGLTGLRSGIESEIKARITATFGNAAPP